MITQPASRRNTPQAETDLVKTDVLVLKGIVGVHKTLSPGSDTGDDL